MKIDAYSVLIILSVIVVVSYAYNYVSRKIKIPSVLLLIGSGIGLKYAASAFNFSLPPTQTLLEILGITGLIFIVLEASLDLEIRRDKLRLIGRAFLSALILLGVTAAIIAMIFSEYYGVTFNQALIHAIPLSVISSAIAIPSVSTMEEEKKEFVVYESTFSDVLGIIAFNYFLSRDSSGFAAIATFGWELILIIIISVASTMLLIFLLNKATTNVRFFLAFAILVLTYSTAKYFHLPSLILVLCFGLVLNNFRLIRNPTIHRLFSFTKIVEMTKELKVMTAETAFIIRTFFFLLFGYSIDLTLMQSQEVLVMGAVIIALTILLRFIFLRYALRINSAPLTLIAPRGLITILLFYSIPPEQRMEQLSEGVLFIVIVVTGLVMTIGLLLHKREPIEKVEEII
jgi:Kef-type K+ transport system membrane component KefB